MTTYKKDIGKDATLSIQMNLADVLKIKRDIQTTNNESDLDNFPIFDLRKRFVQVSKNFVKINKGKMRRRKKRSRILFEGIKN